MTDDQKAPENELAQLLWEAAGALDPDAYPELVGELETTAASLQAQEPVVTVMRHEYTDGNHPENGFSNADWARIESLEPGTKLYRHPPTSAVPEGWKLVPVEPDYNMIKAADEKLTGRSGVLSIADAYQAMLAAAPMPESKGVQWYRKIKAAGQQGDSDDV